MMMMMMMLLLLAIFWVLAFIINKTTLHASTPNKTVGVIESENNINDSHIMWLRTLSRFKGEK